MDWILALKVIQQYGPLVLVVCFLLWQGWTRECRLLTRINKLEDGQQKVLLLLVQKCAQVITKNTGIMQRLERVLDQRWGETKE